MKESARYKFSFAYLFSLMGQFKRGVWLIIALNVLWSIFQICIPFLTKAIVDSGIENRDVNIVLVILVAQFFLFIGITLSDVYRKWLLRHIGVRINLQLIINFLRGIIRKPFTFFNVQEQGKLIQHFNDNLRIESFLTTHASSFFNSALKIVVYAFLLFIFSVKLGFIFVAFNLGLIIWIAAFLPTREVVDEARFKVSAETRTELIELFAGIIDLKAYNQEENRINSWDRIQSKFSDLRLNMLRINQIIYSGVNSLAQLRDILIIFFAAVATINGEMTLGTLLAIQYILGQLNEPVNQLIDFVPQYQDAKLSLGRINEAILSEEHKEPEVTVADIPRSAPIRLESVSFSYTTKKAVDNISLEIPFGKSVAILGESGSGKSTLLRLMLKLLIPNKGTLWIGAKNLSLVQSGQWLDHCSVVLQDSMLFQRSILYNITFETDPSLIDIERVHRCLELCHIEDAVHVLPNGLQSIVGGDGINFSKGQIQRLLLSRALYKDVDYYFLDEPFSALDRLTYHKVFRNLRSALQEKTLVIVTHRMEVAMKMDNIYLLEEGQIVESGHHDDLTKLGRRYTKIFLSDEDE